MSGGSRNVVLFCNEDYLNIQSTIMLFNISGMIYLWDANTMKTTQLESGLRYCNLFILNDCQHKFSNIKYK